MSNGTGISLKSLRKLKVVDTSTAETLGRVKDLRIDPSGPRLASIVVKGGVIKNGVIRAADVIGFGPDAITVGSSDVLVEDDEQCPAASDAYGARLLDDAGTHLGKVADLAIDETGTIISVTAGKTVLAQTLRGIGSYAVVVARA